MKGSAQLTGTVLAYGVAPLRGVLVVNITADAKTVTDAEGKFSIAAKPSDEIRFARAGYERNTFHVAEIPAEISVSLLPSVHLIEPVEINPYRPTGNLAKDAKNLDKNDKIAALQKEIGVPGPPEKPRETPPPTREEVGTLKYVMSNLTLENLYKNLSGDGRRMRQLYRYEDNEEAAEKVLKSVPEGYFEKAGIPALRFTEFMLWAASQDSQIMQQIKLNNYPAAVLRLEKFVPIFIKRLNNP